MDAALMSFRLHDRGIHVVSKGAPAVGLVLR